MSVKRTLSVVVVVALLLIASTEAREAKVFMIKVPDAKEIDRDRDHFSVIFVSGWVSKQDSLLQTIFSKASKLTVEASAAGKYFDGDQLKNAWVVENTDIGHKLDRPWGIANMDLLFAIPADTVNMTFSVKMAAYNEDRIKQVIDAFKGAQPTTAPAGFSLTVEPYLTYASIGDALFSTLFGTNQTTFPFLIETGIVNRSISTTNGFYEHYIIAIAPNSDKDEWLRTLDGSKLTYDPNGSLQYDGQLVRDHTYAVVLVNKAPKTDIVKLLFSSKSAWAVLALTNFYNAPLPDIGGKDVVPRIDKSTVEQLVACVDQLKRELRFSGFDRAVALLAFAEQGRGIISAACKAKRIADADCTTPQIDAYKDRIKAAFDIKTPIGLTGEGDVFAAAKKLNNQINQQLTSMQQ